MPATDRPRPARVPAHLVRVVGALCVVVAAFAFGPVEAALFALVLLGQVVPWALAVPPALDLAVGVVLLLAAWSAVAELYEAVPWLDLVAHLVATGLLAVMAQQLLVRAGALAPRPSRPRLGAVITTTALGLALAVLWEVGEWFGHTYLDDDITVGYDDTLGDLAAGGVGALLAGLLLARRTATAPAQPRQAQISSSVTRKPTR